MSETNWIPGLAVLGAGAVIGAILWLRTQRGAVSAHRTDAGGTDLERQRDAIYVQIRDLDAGRASMSADDYRAERMRLVIEAARTLQAMSGAAVTPVTPPPRSPSWADRHPTLVGMFWGAGLVGFGTALWFGLNTDVKLKPPEAMQGGMGGMSAAPDAEQRAAMQKARMQGLLDSAKAAYDTTPDDPAVANRYAHVLLQAGELMPAFEVTKKVTAVHPDDPEARTHQAIVLMEIGDMDMAAGLLDKVITTTPAFAEALGYRGAIAYNRGEYPAAADLWLRAKAADPSMAGMLDPLIASAQAGGPKNPVAGVEGAPAGTSTGGPPGMSSAPTDRDVSGTVALAAGVAAPTQGMVFIYARPAGVEGGPPAAVVRVPISAFPLSFRLGPNDSPMGGPFPDTMTLTARVDHDGNPSTKEPEDLEGRVESVTPAQSGITLTLKRRGP